ncbi:MAG TPA: tetratricopeptide repeat protein, partial [Burkholderiales bacterium]|nr:tetratricopeptide repeat protein [Burkholderiales bacterium]
MDRAQDAADREDYETAFSIWSDLAEQGVPRAQCNLGVLYSCGWGVQRDDYLARKWFASAADAGDPIAQRNLALMYAEGRCPDGGIGMAAEWF